MTAGADRSAARSGSICLPEGHTIAYTARGTGTPIVMLHPLGLNGSYWDPIAEQLAPDHQVICLDLRGHGRSRYQGSPFHLDDLVTDVIAVMAKLLEGPATLVGCSLGGMVAQGVALRAPNRVARLVLADTRATWDDTGRQIMAQRARAARASGPEHSQYIATTIERWFSPEFRERQPDVVARTREVLEGTDPAVQSWAWMAIGELAYETALPRCTVPTLVVCGALDTSCPPAASKLIVQALPHGSYAEIPGAAHLAPLEEPAQFATLVRDFIAA